MKKKKKINECGVIVPEYFCWLMSLVLVRNLCYCFYERD